MSRSKSHILTPQALQAALPPLSQANTVWIACSGGCDSHVLLHALAQLRRSSPFVLKAVYVNHGLSPNAAQWGEHCHGVCEALDVEFVNLKVDATPKQGESPEAAARHARYAAIKEVLEPGDYLCTAHHQEDQAETLLLQLLRGAGPKGLAGMPPSSPLGTATQLRPLLGFSQAQIHAYAREHGLQWIEDESNIDTGFNRNFLRHEIMPRLRQRWPAADTTIARSAAHCAAAAQLLEALAAEDYQTVKSESSTELEIEKLFGLDTARQKNLLRYWIHQAGLPLPSEVKLQHILSDVLPAAGDKTPLVQWCGAEVRRFNGRLYIMPPLPEFDPLQVIPWADLDQPLVLPTGMTLVCRKGGTPPALSLTKLRSATLEVRFRHGGERIRPAGKLHHVDLKKLLQQHHVPPWRRRTIPLIFADGRLVQVTGLCVGDEVCTEKPEDALLIQQC